MGYISFITTLQASTPMLVPNPLPLMGVIVRYTAPCNDKINPAALPDIDTPTLFQIELNDLSVKYYWDLMRLLD